MIEKKLRAPSYTARRVRKKIVLFREKTNALSASGMHVREENGVILCAEGREDLGALPAGTRRILRSEGPLGYLFADLGGGNLNRLDDGIDFSLPAAPAQILSCYDETGTPLCFAVTEDGVYRLGTPCAKVEGAAGSCAAIHRERLFTAEGNRVRYSAPLSFTDFAEKTREGGYVDLPSSGGEIAAMFSYKEKLFLFRERGITLLRASGDPLEFSSEEIPYACGRIVAGSIADCGRYLLFLTESGLYSFNGNYCTLLDECGSEQISGEEGVSAVSADGKYYATVRVRGEKCVYCVDPVRKKGSFLRIRPDSVAGGRTLRYSCDGRLYCLTAQGAGERDCLVETELSLFGLSAGEKLLDALTLEGTGRYFVTVYSERGLPRHVRGNGGEIMKLDLPLRGNSFGLRIRTGEEKFRLRAVTLALREADE